jgi:hypothetical protein
VSKEGWLAERRLSPDQRRYMYASDAASEASSREAGPARLSHQMHNCRHVMAAAKSREPAAQKAVQDAEA